MPAAVTPLDVPVEPEVVADEPSAPTASESDNGGTRSLDREG
jgi:hypothetical protein